MLTRNHRQEVLSRAYIQIVAAACGMSYDPRGIDYGFDMTLHELQIDDDGRRSESGFGIDLQVKSTSAPTWKRDELLFDLPVKNYNDLRQPGTGRCRLLVVLSLPEEENLWVKVEPAGLLLRDAAYWHSLAGLPAPNNRKTARVAIPRSRLFSPEALASLIDRVKRGEAP